MPSIYELKPAFQNLLRPLCRRLVAAGITANQVTAAAIVLSVASGAAIFWFHQERWPFFVVPAVLFVRMALNAIDGMIAREHNQQTPLGAVLNELGDVVSDVALYLPLAIVPGLDARWIVAIVVLGVISEMAGVVAVQIGAGRRYDGPMGKSDRAFLFGALCLLLGIGVATGFWLDAILILAAVLLILTILNRSRGALKEIAP